MTSIGLSDWFKTLAALLRGLRTFLENYVPASPTDAIGQELDKQLGDTLEGLTRQRRATESAGLESLHWKTKALLGKVDREVVELENRLTALRVAASMYYAPPIEESVSAPREAASAALIAAVGFALPVLRATENRFSALSEHYSRRLEDTRLGAEAPEWAEYSYFSDIVPPSREAAAAPIPYALVPVMFATDRKIAGEGNPQHVTFSGGRAEGILRYGVAEVSIPPGHNTGRLERPRLWKFQIREDPENHITIVTCEQTDLTRWKAIASDRIADAETNAALVFIHGFNVSFDDAIRRAAQIGWDLKFKGVTAAFSWSSEGKTLSYLADESNARLAVPRFSEFLRVLKQDVGVSTIHLVAHSMGNLVLIEALRNMTVAQPGDSGLAEIVLAAPDVDADEFKAAVRQLKGKAKRYTLYGSEKDDALVASKKLRANYSRAGDGGQNIVVVQDIDSIDATSVGKDLFGFGHSYFSSKRKVLDDLYYLINEALPPARRAGLEELTKGGLIYWSFQV